MCALSRSQVLYESVRTATGCGLTSLRPSDPAEQIGAKRERAISEEIFRALSQSGLVQGLLAKTRPPIADVDTLNVASIVFAYADSVRAFRMTNGEEAWLLHMLRRTSQTLGRDVPEFQCRPTTM